MRINHIWNLLTVAAISAVAIISCKSDSGILEADDINQSISEPMLITETGKSVRESSMEVGHVRVYVSGVFDQSVSRRIKEEGLLPVDEFNKKDMEVLSDLGVYRIQRTFPYAGEFEKRTHEAGLDRWYDVWFDKSYPIEKAFSALSKVESFDMVEYRPLTMKYFTDEVEVVENPSASVTAATIFDDPYLKDQWHYYNDGSKGGSVAGCDINVVPVWQAITTGDPSVIVAVVDEGVQFDHEDLNANMWINPSIQTKVYGHNFITNGNTIHPGDHGTHVAGTIAAVNNNGKGVSGIAGGNYQKGSQGVKIMSCQIFDGDDSAPGAAAIKWAADNGAVIAQNSWGYPKINYVPSSDRAAIDYFNTYAGFDANGNQVGPMAGGIVIFAAGNEGRNHGYPAEYEGALAVGAVGSDFYRSYYSCFGDWVDLAAPGGDATKGFYILSTLSGNKYGRMQGTSMACPHVSGVAALIVSQYGGPGFTRDMLWNRLVNTSKDLSEYNSVAPVGRLVNALGSMASLSDIAPDPVSEFSAEILKSNYIKINITVPADEDDQKAYGVNVYYDTKPITAINTIPYKSVDFGGLDAGQSYTGTISGLDFNTKYYLRCVAYDLAGNRSELSKEISIVTSKNTPPAVQTNGLLEFDVRAHETKYLVFTYSDEDGHNMNPFLETSSAADTICVTGLNKAQIVIIGKNDNPGTYTSTVNVSDEYDAVTSFTYKFTLYPNHAPVKKQDFPNVLVKVGETAEVPLADYVTDEDGEILSFISNIANPSIANASVGNGKLYVTGLSGGNTAITLNATDALGESVSSSFNIVTRTGSQEYDIYPSTVSTNLYIRTGETEESVTVKVLSSNGGVVVENTVNASAFNPAVIDMSGCAPGVYKVIFSFGGKTYQTTVSKI